jgi:hypothetical protein
LIHRFSFFILLLDHSNQIMAENYSREEEAAAEEEEEIDDSVRNIALLECRHRR